MKIIFDIGGTNMRFSYVENGKIGPVLKVRTPEELEKAQEVILQSISKIAEGETVESLIGGVPGSVKDGVIITAPNLKNWNSFGIRVFLQKTFGNNVFIYNDASMAALGESVYGAGRGKGIVAYIGIGTGIGGARVVGGEIDANSAGFEPGHHIIDVGTGRSFSQIVSGQAIWDSYKKHAEDLGQSEVQKLLPMLAVGIYNSIVFWSPEVLVIGGSLMNEDTAFRIEYVKKALQEIKTEMRLPTEVRKAELGDNSGLYGAMVMTERVKGKL